MDRHILPQPPLLVPSRHSSQLVQRLGTGGAGTSSSNMKVARNYANQPDFVQPPPGKGPPSSWDGEKSTDDNRKTLPPVTSIAPLKSKENMGSDASSSSQPPAPWSASNAPWSSAATRPLSDIRELTEPSLAELNFRNSQLDMGIRPSVKRQNSLARKESVSGRESLGRKHSTKGKSTPKGKSRQHGPTLSVTAHILELEGDRPVTPGNQTDRSSAYSLSLENVPPRSSSCQQDRDKRNNSVPRLAPPSLPPPPPRGLGYTIPNHGHSQSPVKEAVTHVDPAYSDGMHRAPSRTFVRTLEPNYDVLEFPKHQHPRTSVELHVGASLFVGGGSVEGYVRITVDDLERIRHRRQLAISRVSIDLLGVEEMAGARRNIYLNLATELLDSNNPPPHNMVESLKHISPLDPFWLLTPSVSTLPFLLSLPLDVGPPPFQSKHAKIRYVLSVTVLIRDQGKQYLVRCSQDVSVVSVYDPEKALMSLPSPLTASDEYIRYRDHGPETIKITAGLHRQVWVSGTSIFVDVHIANRSQKTIKKVELQLERDILCYKHAAATTLERSASQARIFDSNERAILNKTVLKNGMSGWNGVLSYSSDIRTCDLELPRGHATVKCGKYFEVRYFLNVVASISRTKTMTVQLPIVLIHMNSLDVVPNSVAQVAAAIEEKRAKVHQRNRSRLQNQSQPRANEKSATLGPAPSPSPLARRPSSSSSVQGRAFNAPRKQSLDRMRAGAEELCELGKLLDTSPRKYFYSPRRRAIASQYKQPIQVDTIGYHTPPSNRKARKLGNEVGDEVADIRERLRKMRSSETNRSATSDTRGRVGDASGLRRGPSTRSADRSADGNTSKAGFRELEVGIGLRSESPAVLPSRFESLGARQSNSRKMKSAECWKPSWLSDRKETRSRERSRDREREYKEREKDERQKMMANWI